LVLQLGYGLQVIEDALQYLEQHALLESQDLPFAVHAVLAAHVIPSVEHVWLSQAFWSQAHLPMSESQWHLLYTTPLEQ
jgi:hypothetical protein